MRLSKSSRGACGVCRRAIIAVGIFDFLDTHGSKDQLDEADRAGSPHECLSFSDLPKIAYMCDHPFCLGSTESLASLFFLPTARLLVE